MTEIVRELNEQTLKKIVKIIDDGGLIAFPTETVYALAGDAANSSAVEKIYSLKQRALAKALPILVGDIYQAKRICEFDERAKKLALVLFPGPLTIVLNKKPYSNIAVNVNQNMETIGVRMPNSLTALKILQAVGRPLVGTSANISNTESPTNVSQILKHFGEKIDIIIDQGDTEIGIPSTIVDLSTEEVKILREGIITAKKIAEILS